MGTQASDAELGVTLSRLPLLGLAALLIGATPPQAAEMQSAERVRAHVEFLASDLLEGRDTGSRGHQIAANYVASEFRQLGLKPAGTNGGWFVDVPFRRATFAAPPAISLTVNGRKTKAVFGRDAAVRPSVTEQSLALTAPLVFVGHGVRDARLHIDDYAGLDVRGKIVVALSDPVPGIPGETAAHLVSMQAQIAGAQGAAGIITIYDAGTAASTVDRFATRPLVDWVDAQGRTGRGGAIHAQIAISSEWAERLFARAPMTMKAIRTQVALGKRVRSFALPATMTLAATSKWQDFTSPEVVGCCPEPIPSLRASMSC